MKVLLTGASGFLGRYVLQHMHAAGIETVVLGRRPPVYPAGHNTATSSWVEADLLATTDWDAVCQETQATHLLHLAWYAEHGQYWASPLNLRWVEATLRLAESFCRTGGKRMVMAGTCAEYDWSHGYCREASTPLRPATLYGTSKDATRRLVMAIGQQHQVSCAWGRIFLPFGTGENRQRLIPALMEALRGQRPAFGINATAYRDFLHASDVASALVTLLHHSASGAYNISSGQPVQLATLVRELAALLHSQPDTVLNLTTERPGEPELLVGQNQALRALGWSPTLSLRQGLLQTLDTLIQPTPP